MQTLLRFFEHHRFSVISWSATIVLVAALLGSTVWWTQSGAALPAVGKAPTSVANQSPLALPNNPTGAFTGPSIFRLLDLKTDISAQSSLQPVSYKVLRGDNLSEIAQQYKIKAMSILYSNQATLNDNPYNLAPGMTLIIPPEDGLLYTWKTDDTLQSVADKFKADLNGDKKVDKVDAALLADAIVSYPGNNLDLTNPVIKPGQVIMVPGGVRELAASVEFIPGTDRAGGSTATSELSPSGCNTGTGSPPGIWPTSGPHTISGNDYTPSHLGIDITATEGMPILAAGGGVAVFVGFSQYGYGNVIEIDHGDGYTTLYAHLSGFNLAKCQVVGGGQVIGYAGCTGNCTGPHLHFEVRRGGVNVNPWGIVQ